MRPYSRCLALLARRDGEKSRKDFAFKDFVADLRLSGRQSGDHRANGSGTAVAALDNQASQNGREYVVVQRLIKDTIRRLG